MTAFVLALGLLAVDVPAQQRPDLSGTWILNMTHGQGQASGSSAGAGASAGRGAATAGGLMRGGARMAGGTGTPAEIRLTQAADRLTVRRTVGAREETVVHTFDGAENVSVNGLITLKTRSRWDGDKLVTEGTQVFAGPAGEMVTTLREVRSLAADGTLVVDRERMLEGRTTRSTQSYRRK